MIKKIIFLITMGIGLLSAQEVLDKAFPINGSTVSTDSIEIPAGMIPSGVWSSTLIAGTTVGFKMSIDGGATFLTVGEMGVDTTAWAIPLDKNAGLIVPLQPTKAYLMKGSYASDDASMWLKVTSSVAQTATTSVINIRFIPYTGRNQ